MQYFRRIIAAGGLMLVVACSVPANVDAPQVEMGNFLLGHNIVVVNAPEQGPLSRDASDEELKAALVSAIDQRFGRYDGDKFYHIGVKLDGYALALPGIPIVFTPKSFMVITVNIWDDAAGEKVNEEDKAFSIFEGISGKTIVSSGLTQTKEQQLATLAANAAKAIQDWILENPEWIGLPPLADAADDAAGLPTEP